MNKWIQGCKGRQDGEAACVLSNSVTYPSSVAVAKSRAISDRLKTAYLVNEAQKEKRK